jgi:hypothetical protein
MVLDHVRSADPVIVALERFIGANLQRQLSGAQMAHATATSPRTLARKLEQSLGTTPLHFAALAYGTGGPLARDHAPQGGRRRCRGGLGGCRSVSARNRGVSPRAPLTAATGLSAPGPS